MKILVTGGLGFIGSHTVVALIERGFEIVIVDDLSNSSIDILHRINSITGKQVIFEQLDLKNEIEVERLFSKYFDIEAVIHFAAFKSVNESINKPLDYYKNNIYPIINLLDQFKKKDGGHFIFSSSCTVYGEANSMPITEEESRKEPFSPYGNTKRIGEDIINDFCKISKVSAVILRYFNPIGAHASGLIGELPTGVPQNLIPFITQSAIGKRGPISIYGIDYPTDDGTCIRDYIHVVDLAQAHVVAVERLLKKDNSSVVETYNIGTGRGTSVLEIIKTFEKVNGIKLDYSFKSRREGDVATAYASTIKANNVLGWQPKETLDAALKSAWEWEKSLFESENS
ncbi:UDP-glucose 4-epimerase GalE [Myroides sp. LJL119]